MRAAIVYYSLEGNIKKTATQLCEKLQDREVETEVIEVRTVKPYPKKGLAKFLFGGKDASFGRTPEIAPIAFDPADYDLVVLALPVWAGKAAAPINSVLEGRDFSDTKVALAIASASGDASSCAKDLAKKLGRSADALPTLSLRNPAKLPDSELDGALDGFADRLAQAPAGGGGAF